MVDMNGKNLTGKIPGRIKYTFAFGALGKDLIYGMIATFSMIYFTDILKVNPIFIGGMFFVAKLWDAFNDLFMGMVVDNTKSKWGKFIPWLVIGTLVNAVIFVLLFTDFHLSGVSLCIFATVAYILWGMTYTIMDIPYWSIIPNLSSDPEEREKVSVLPRIFASIGQSLIIAGFGVQIISGLGGGQIGYHKFALIIAATFIFTIGVTVFNLPKNTDSSVPKKKVKFKDIFSIIKKNDQLRWAVALILLYNVGYQCIMGVSTYYFAYVCGNAGMMSAFMISASVAEVVGLIVFPKVAKIISRKVSFLLACIMPTIGLSILLIISFVAPTNIILTAISGIIVKLGTGLELGCATVFLADVVDYGEFRVGTRNEGVVFSLQTLIVKFTAAITALGIGFALGSTQYVPGQEQSIATTTSIRALMCVIPAVFMIIAYVVYKNKYKLNDIYMKEIIKTISARRDGEIKYDEVIDETGKTIKEQFDKR
ncbi:melibiose:sodium transporter MelB [Clostridium sp. BJN0001]|uniref:melibiose:sodium transporter MelB n=1 Tax=Clostridium sp. BJN0001 TaxID=2930219 RepID=UPI001FD44E49|nr:melibiose:sodium transporter MelB [Clostridium sp. BJN0001]